MATEFIQTGYSMLAFILPGHSELVIILILGLLIFGRRLPEVGRNIGRSIVEFKRGIKGVSEEIEEESAKNTPQISDSSSKESLPGNSHHNGNSGSVATADSGASGASGGGGSGNSSGD